MAHLIQRLSGQPDSDTVALAGGKGLSNAKISREVPRSGGSDNETRGVGYLREHENRRRIDSRSKIAPGDALSDPRGRNAALGPETLAVGFWHRVFLRSNFHLEDPTTAARQKEMVWSTV